jgi:hypothetical protein
MVHSARRASSILAWTLRDEMPQIRHQHVATEPRAISVSFRYFYEADNIGDHQLG